jgi:membrane protease YdiL (CAAX protease family)
MPPVAYLPGGSHFAAMLGVLLTAALFPLLLVVPAYWRGRIRARNGSAPGWQGEGWTLWHVWLALALFLIAQIVVFYALQPTVLHDWLTSRRGSHIELTVDPPGLEEQLLLGALAVGSTLLVTLVFAPWRLLGKGRWTLGRTVAIAVATFFGLRLLIVALAPVIPELHGSGGPPQRDLMEAVLELVNEHGPFLTSFLIAGFAPFVEELLFRGALLTGLARHISFAWANVIQAALFAGLHFTPSLAPFFFAMGIAAGLMVRSSGGLAPAILLHALNNASVIVALWWFGDTLFGP